MLKCETCGKRFKYAGVGRKSKYCHEHRPHRNHHRDDARLKSRGGTPPRRTGGGHVQYKSLDPARMALGLSVVDDPKSAAELMGIHGHTDKQLKAIARTAKKDWADFVSGEKTATSRIIHAALGALALRLLDSVKNLSAAQVAPSFKCAMQALDMYQGGTQNAYTHIELVLPPPPDGVDAGSIRQTETRPEKVH